MKSFLPKSKSELLLWQMNAFIILVVAGLCSGSSLEINGGDGVAAPREFDYFKLALQWPGTICQRSRHCCSSNACCRRYSYFHFFFFMISCFNPTYMSSMPFLVFLIYHILSFLSVKKRKIDLCF